MFGLGASGTPHHPGHRRRALRRATAARDRLRPRQGDQELQDRHLGQGRDRRDADASPTTQVAAVRRPSSRRLGRRRRIDRAARALRGRRDAQRPRLHGEASGVAARASRRRRRPRRAHPARAPATRALRRQRPASVAQACADLPRAAAAVARAASQRSPGAAPIGASARSSSDTASVAPIALRLVARIVQLAGHDPDRHRPRRSRSAARAASPTPAHRATRHRDAAPPPAPAARARPARQRDEHRQRDPRAAAQRRREDRSSGTIAGASRRRRSRRSRDVSTRLDFGSRRARAASPRRARSAAAPASRAAQRTAGAGSSGGAREQIPALRVAELGEGSLVRIRVRRRRRFAVRQIERRAGVAELHLVLEAPVALFLEVARERIRGERRARVRGPTARCDRSRPPRDPRTARAPAAASASRGFGELVHDARGPARRPGSRRTRACSASSERARRPPAVAISSRRKRVSQRSQVRIKAASMRGPRPLGRGCVCYRWPGVRAGLCVALLAFASAQVGFGRAGARL